MSGPESISAAGLVIVAKAHGMTSHDVVAQCRKIFNTRAVGHAGTLDPMATGVLVLGIHRATKLLGLLSLTTKSYEATIRLGASTSTDDAEGDILSSAPTDAVRDDDIRREVQALTGDIMQVPAKVSAIKVDGRRAHTLARTGADFELAARPVTVSEFVIDDMARVGQFIDIRARVTCSSGTYVRSLARDLGAALGVGGHLTALARTRVGPFDIAAARSLEEIAAAPQVSLDLDAATQTAFPVRSITAEQAEDISQGRWLDPIGIADTYAAVDPDGHTIALLREKGRRASSVMVVRPANMRPS